MSKGFVQIESTICFSQTVGTEQLPLSLGPGNPIEPGQILKSDRSLIVRWMTSANDKELHGIIQTAMHQHSLTRILASFKEYSPQLITKCKDLGAEKMTARLLYYPEGEGTEEVVELITWTKHSYFARAKKAFKAEFFKSVLPSFLIILIVVGFAVEGDFLSKAKYALLTSFLVTVSLTYIAPLFENNKEFVRD
ncbi:hypothetical protein [Bdellovibrio sp. BCCA]|uniref:hypothetical protein n=1 Tax=Bdellovibrio sp. BCCA TaxID=3136281 RepID=UPI0030F1EF04